MRIVHINTYGNYGGAGIACQRISEAINLNLPGSSFILDKDTNEQEGGFIREKSIPSWLTKIYFFLDLWYGKILGLQKRFQFGYSSARFGRSIADWDLVRKADIIHLHWFNQGFLSLKSLEQLARLEKPVVWTLHDMWAMTGGCHYAGTCKNYLAGCGACYMMNSYNAKDLSSEQFLIKEKVYKELKPFIVGPSHWMVENAKASLLLKDFSSAVIPNPINTHFYKPGNRREMREKYHWGEEDFIIIMNAFKINNENKGFKYLVEALEILRKEHPEISEKVRLILIGGMKFEIPDDFPVRVEVKGFISDPNLMISLNQGADVYTTPSLQDNLPNTIMEALSCGIPTVAFGIGGIPDLVEHKVTGYLAERESSEDFANGLEWVYIQNKTSDFLRVNCRQKALKEFESGKIGKDYIALYQRLAGIN